VGVQVRMEPRERLHREAKARAAVKTAEVARPPPTQAKETRPKRVIKLLVWQQAEPPDDNNGVMMVRVQGGGGSPKQPAREAKARGGKGSAKRSRRPPTKTENPTAKEVSAKQWRAHDADKAGQLRRFRGRAHTEEGKSTCRRFWIGGCGGKRRR
jgi:hypothetical protein